MREPIVFWDVDTQIDFMDPWGALYVPGATEIEAALGELTETARSLSIPVIADADDHELSDAEISTEPDFQATFPPHCIRGTRGAERVRPTQLDWTLELDHELRPRDDIRRALDTMWPRVLIHKKELDVFSNPNAELVLAALDPAQVVVYGVALDFCVRKVVEGLLERDERQIVVLTDATRAIYPRQATRLLEQWSAAGVRLETVATFLPRLARPARAAFG